MEKDKNGWTKIESENDYPTKDCRYWIANKNGVFDFFSTKEGVIGKFENKTLTHYKELEEPMPPSPHLPLGDVKCEYMHDVGCIKDICICNKSPKKPTPPPSQIIKEGEDPRPKI